MNTIHLLLVIVICSIGLSLLTTTATYYFTATVEERVDQTGGADTVYRKKVDQLRGIVAIMFQKERDRICGKENNVKRDILRIAEYMKTRISDSSGSNVSQFCDIATLKKFMYDAASLSPDSPEGPTGSALNKWVSLNKMGIELVAYIMENKLCGPDKLLEIDVVTQYAMDIYDIMCNRDWETQLSNIFDIIFFIAEPVYVKSEQQIVYKNKGSMSCHDYCKAPWNDEIPETWESAQCALSTVVGIHQGDNKTMSCGKVPNTHVDWVDKDSKSQCTCIPVFSAQPDSPVSREVPVVIPPPVDTCPGWDCTSPGQTCTAGGGYCCSAENTWVTGKCTVDGLPSASTLSTGSGTPMIVTHGNNGGVSCDTYCAGTEGGPWNNELPSSWGGAKCVGTDTEGKGCADTGGPQIKCKCSPDKDKKWAR